MIQVELNQDEWIKILDLLANHPYRQVAPLIDKMQQQLLPQIKPELSKPNGDLRPGAPQ